MNNVPHLDLPGCPFDFDTFLYYYHFLRIHLSEYKAYAERLSPSEIHEFVDYCNYFIQYLSLCISRFEEKYPEFSLDPTPED